jgi:hypothetical protein
MCVRIDQARHHHAPFAIERLARVVVGGDIADRENSALVDRDRST